MVEEVFKRASGHGVLSVDTIVSQLVYYGIGFIRDAFTVAIDIHSKRRSRLYRIFAQVPYAVEERIARFEVRGIIIERIADIYTGSIVDGDGL